MLSCILDQVYTHACDMLKLKQHPTSQYDNSILTVHACLQCTYSIVVSTVNKYECEETAEAISRIFTDEIMEQWQQLTKFLVKLLNFLLSCNLPSQADLAKAYFVCYNQVLKFEYKGKGLYILYI